MDYRELCSIMEACIPASEFKHQVVKLHVDMLNEIESLRAKLAESESRLDLLNSLAKHDISYDRYGNGGRWSIGLFSEDSYMRFKQAIDAAIAKQNESES